MSNQERITNLIGKPFSCIVNDEIKFFNMISITSSTSENVVFKAYDLQKLKKEVEVTVAYKNIISAAFLA